jgi:hypothetical protein
VERGLESPRVLLFGTDARLVATPFNGGLYHDLARAKQACEVVIPRARAELAAPAARRVRVRGG